MSSKAKSTRRAVGTRNRPGQEGESSVAPASPNEDPHSSTVVSQSPVPSSETATHVPPPESASTPVPIPSDILLPSVPATRNRGRPKVSGAYQLSARPLAPAQGSVLPSSSSSSKSSWQSCPAPAEANISTSSSTSSSSSSSSASSTASSLLTSSSPSSPMPGTDNNLSSLPKQRIGKIGFLDGQNGSPPLEQDEEYEVDADGTRRRINSFFSKEQEEEFEKIFAREQQIGSKFSRKELRELARSMNIPAGGELRLFRWFENRRAWIKVRHSKRAAPKSDGHAQASRSAKRRRSPGASSPAIIVDLSTHPAPSSVTTSGGSLSFNSLTSGTFISAPSSIDPTHRSISDLPLSSLVSTGMLIDLTDYLANKSDHPSPNSIDYDAFPVDLHLSEKALILHAGKTTAAPFLTETAAHVLAEKGVSLVAIDWPSLDPASPTPGPSKSLLLQSNIPVIEKLSNVAELLAKLNQLPPQQQSFHLNAVPLAIPALGIAPVRAYAIIPS